MTFRRTRCPQCKTKLEPGQRIHPACIEAFAEATEAKAKRAQEKQARMAAKVDRAETRRRKDAIKTKPQLTAAAQQAMNAWVRARDAHQPCISCGAPPPDLSQLHAGRDAGHYRSVGSAPGVRFDPANIHAQCVSCNQWKSGSAVDYRIGLVARIGLERVEALEADNTPRKYTHDELRAIRADYTERLKQLKKEREL